MTIEKAKKIVRELEGTISKMKKNVVMESINPMFKAPRAKKSDLVRKKNELKKKYKI
tara:strand:+ start:777 stop:947 length:171 start_codon:yes stop_codon:yes gene_type:complete